MNRTLHFFLVVCLATLGFSPALADELEDLIQEAFNHNPSIQAAREGTRQAVAARDASDEFLDPNTTAAAGRSYGNAGAPLLSSLTGLPAVDAYGASASVEVPFRPGVYAGVGISEQYRVNPSEGIGSGHQTLVGVQIRIPLLQDRGFSLWKRNQSRLAELRVAADGRLLESQQTVRHAVEQAYIAYLEQIANAATSSSADERAQQLLSDAEELVRLKVIPEYQLAPARLELAFRREEVRAARQAIDTARLRLEQILGIASDALTTNANVLVERVARAHLPETPPAEPSFGARGSMREVEAMAAAAAAETRALDDRLRPDLSLSVRGVWATEDSSSPDDSAGLVADKNTSAAAVLVWTRSWSQTGTHARLRESRAREAQLTAIRHDLQTRLAADRAAAHREFTGARERLKELTVATEQARRALDAEAERFRLGEGRSRNVLDAQNDLTKAYRSRNSVAAALLRGESDFLFATGYSPDDNRSARPPPPQDTERTVLPDNARPAPAANGDSPDGHR